MAPELGQHVLDQCGGGVQVWQEAVDHPVIALRVVCARAQLVAEVWRHELHIHNIGRTVGVTSPPVNSLTSPPVNGLAP